jgi:lambda family phage portal protein
MLARLAAAWSAFRSPMPAVVTSQAPLAVPYEAASTRRRLAGWMPGTLGPNDSTLGGIRTLRDRSRASIRNDGYARKIPRILASEMLGTGIAPKSSAPDSAYRDLVDALWTRSVPELDADGRLDGYGLQWLAVKCWLEAGEAFVRERLRLPTDGLVVPIQFQVIEPELVPVEDTRPLANGHRVRAGIEFDAIGRRVAYHVYRTRPGDQQDFEMSQTVRIPAESLVSHLCTVERAGQIRGVPQLTQALVALRDLDGFNDATLLRQRLANLFLGWVEQVTGVNGGAALVDPITGQEAQSDASGLATIGPLEPGMVLTPPPGQRLAFNDPPKVGPEYEAFNRLTLRRLASASDVPYHSLTGDMEQVNDRTIRVILQEFRRYVEQLQWFFVVPQLCRPMWLAWFRRAVVSGALPVPPDFRENYTGPWADAEWTPEAWSYINPVQDVQADKERVRAGFAARRQIIRERGFDPDAVERERTEELQDADRDGRVDDTDPRKTSKAGLTQEPSDDGADDRDDDDGDRPMRAVLESVAQTLTQVTQALGALRPSGPRIVEKEIQTDARGRIVGVREIHHDAEVSG